MTIPYFDHLSASNANDFIERRPMWFAKYIVGYRFPANPAMALGKAVELGLTEFCHLGNSLEDSIARALEAFDSETAECAFDEAAAKRTDIPRFVTAGAEALGNLIQEHGRIASIQDKVSTLLLPDGLEWIGFTDFIMADGAVVDLKVIGRTKGSLPSGWRRQGALYSKALDGAPVKFLALLPLKTVTRCETYELDGAAQAIEELRQAERAIRRVVSIPQEMMAAAFLPDPDHYTYRDLEPVAESIWGQ